MSDAQLISRFKRMFKCDACELSRLGGKTWLFLCWNRNTAKDREKNAEAGQWMKDGEPYDFDYVKRQVVASGETVAELIESAKEYKRCCSEKWWQHFKRKGAHPDVVKQIKEMGV